MYCCLLPPSVSLSFNFFLRLYLPSIWTVYLGKLHLRTSAQSEEALRVTHIHLHQYYDDEIHDYDLALLRLERPVSASTLALPACLPKPTHQLEPGLLCWVTGWGALREGGDDTHTHTDMKRNWWNKLIIKFSTLTTDIELREVN